MSMIELVRSRHVSLSMKLIYFVKEKSKPKTRWMQTRGEQVTAEFGSSRTLDPLTTTQIRRTTAPKWYFRLQRY